MFQKIKIRLTLICSCSTTLLVLIIVLCCLKVSEDNMYGQEKALFLLRANSISSDLNTENSISIHWYTQNMGSSNILWLELNGEPSSLSSVVIKDEKLSAVSELKDYMKRENTLPEPETSSMGIRQRMFYWTQTAHQNRRFLVMDAQVSMGTQEAEYLYLYSLENLYSRIRQQRIRFFAIWFFSMVVLSAFSYFFASLVLKPVVENDKKQRHFVAASSHELRSPLAVFKTGLSILKTEPDTEKTGRIFTLIDGEIFRMERLIGDLLYLAKAEQASINYQFQMVSLRKILNLVYEKYLPLAKERGISLSLSDADADCICDPQRIEQVIVILLDNALSYTPAGGSVHLSLFYSRNRCCIQVADTGNGIADADKKKIFDRFYRSSSSRSSKEHFGLGLSIAAEICKSHKAKILVSDTKGGGSTFTIMLRAPKKFQVWHFGTLKK